MSDVTLNSRSKHLLGFVDYFCKVLFTNTTNYMDERFTKLANLSNTLSGTKNHRVYHQGICLNPYGLSTTSSLHESLTEKGTALLKVSRAYGIEKGYLFKHLSKLATFGSEKELRSYFPDRLLDLLEIADPRGVIRQIPYEPLAKEDKAFQIISYYLVDALAG